MTHTNAMREMEEHEGQLKFDFGEDINIVPTPAIRRWFFDKFGYMDADEAIVNAWEKHSTKPGRPDEPKTTQVGGDHYKLPIQPIDYITKNNLGYIEGNIIKYVTRYKNKNGVEDLKKAKHYLEMLIEEEERRYANTN